MAQTRPGSLKLWQVLLPPLPLVLHCPAHPSSSNQNPERGRRASQSGASPKAGLHIPLGPSVQPQLLIRDQNVDTSDTLWRLLVEARQRQILLNDS